MLKKLWLIVASFALSGLAHAFYPETGTWVFLDEENGKPGRGLTLDVQNGILLATMFGYEDNGQPTFYTGAGKLEFAQTTSTGGVYDDEPEVSVVIDLKRYTGGRSLGSAAREAIEAGSVGKATFRFVHGTLGFVTLPKENETPITRYAFGTTKRSADEMLGRWLFSTYKYSAEKGGYFFETEVFDFNVIKDFELTFQGGVYKTRYAFSADELMRCEENPDSLRFLYDAVRDFSSDKKCILKDVQGNVLREYYFYMGVNNTGKGYSDLHVGSHTGNEKLLYVQRISDVNGRSITVGNPSTYNFRLH